MRLAGSILLWTVSLLTALFFAATGLGKLFGAASMVHNFEVYGYPQWLRIAVGYVEVFGAIGLLAPSFASVAAASLGAVLLGAGYTHLRLGHDDRELAVVALFMLLGVIIGIARWERRASWLPGRR